MKQYHNLLRTILEEGEDRGDRTGTGTRSIFGYQMRMNLADGFPLLTTKKMFTRGVFEELLWMLHGRTDNQYLNDRDVHIWDSWSTAEQCARFGREEGDLGPIYGFQWRHFGGDQRNRRGLEGGYDQIERLVRDLRENPNSRRHIVSAWNPPEANHVALPPCHTLFQCYVHTDGRLDLHLYQRSADVLLGVPFNIASYALLIHLLAQVCDLKPGTLVHTFGDVHIYQNHMGQVRLQLEREPKPLPKLLLNPAITALGDFTIDDIVVTDYVFDPAIPAPVSI